MKAMGSDVRMAIFRLLAAPRDHFADQGTADPVEFGVCMTLIGSALGIAQPTASRHLEMLRQARFISVSKQQKWPYCKRNDAEILEYLEWFRLELAPGV